MFRALSRLPVRQGASLLQQRGQHTQHTSFNPETYFRFPQFLADINHKLTIIPEDQAQAQIFSKGPLIYTNKCVVLKETAKTALEALNNEENTMRESLDKACSGLFWQSEIDYSLVPCTFSLKGDITAAKFLAELGMDEKLFLDTAVVRDFSCLSFSSLPIISYQPEGDMTVYKSKQEMLNEVLHTFPQVYHISIGEGIINPILQFIVGKQNDSDTVMGIMSASIET